MIRTLAPVCVLIPRCFNLSHSRFHLAFLLSCSILYFAAFGSCGKCCQKFVTCDVACAFISGFNSDVCEHTQDNHLVYDIVNHICGNSSMVHFDSTHSEGITHEPRPNVAFSGFTTRTFSLKLEDCHYDRQCYIKPSTPSDEWPDPFTRDDHNMLNYRNFDVLPYSEEQNLNTKFKTNFPGFHTGLYFHFLYGCNNSMSYDRKSLSTDMQFVSTKFYPVINEGDKVFSVLLNGLFGNLSVSHSIVSHPPCEINHLMGILPDTVVFYEISYFNSGGCRVEHYYDLWKFSESHLKKCLNIKCGNVIYFLGKEIRSHGRKLFLDQQHNNFISSLVDPLVYSVVKYFGLAKGWTLFHPSYQEGLTRLDDSISKGRWHSISCIQFSFSKEANGVELFEVVMESGMAVEGDDPPNLTRVSPASSFRNDDLGGYVNQFVNKNNLPSFSIHFRPEESRRSFVSYPYTFCEEFLEISVTTTSTMVIIPLKFRNPVPMCYQQKGRPLAWVWSKRPFVAALLLFSFLFLALYGFSPQSTASPLNYKPFSCAENREAVPKAETTPFLVPHTGKAFSEAGSPSENPPLENRGPKTGFSTIVSPPKPVKVPDPQLPLQQVGYPTRATKEKKRQRRKKKSGREGSIMAETGGSQSGNSTPSSPSSPISYKNFRCEAVVPTHHLPNSAPSISPLTPPSRSPRPPYDRAPGPKNYSGGVKWEAAGKKEELVYDIWGDHLSGIRLCNVIRGSVDGTEQGSESFFTYGPHVLVKSKCGNGM